jgi:hypothetical protein
MNFFDSDADVGLSPIGSVGLMLALGFGAYILWQMAYERGARDVLRLGNAGCVITGPDGKVLAQAELQQRERIFIPKGATLTGACLNPT